MSAYSAAMAAFASGPLAARRAGLPAPPRSVSSSIRIPAALRSGCSGGSGRRQRCRPPAAGRSLRDWADGRDAPRPLGGWESMEEEEDSDEDLDLFPEEVRSEAGWVARRGPAAARGQAAGIRLHIVHQGHPKRPQLLAYMHVLHCRRILLAYCCPAHSTAAAAALPPTHLPRRPRATPSL